MHPIFGKRDLFSCHCDTNIIQNVVYMHAQLFIVDGAIISAQPIYFASPILILHANRTLKTSSPNLLTCNHLSGISKMKWLETLNFMHNSQRDSP
jgi:hypothetical protein